MPRSDRQRELPISNPPPVPSSQLPVVLFHAGVRGFGGGYVGVDVFFVISGYLITSIILAEQAEGSFSLAGFYERRARRILPALFTVLLVCLPFAWLWMLPNLLQYPIAMFGALRAGLIVVNTNPLYTATELEHQLRDSGATALVVLENFAAVAEQALAAVPVPNVVVTGVGDLLAFPKGALVNFVLRHVQRKVPPWKLPGSLSLTAILKGAAATPAPVEVGHDDIAYLQYTGGTTGVSKGAMLTHGNMVANILQARAWFKQVEIENTTYVCALPL